MNLSKKILLLAGALAIAPAVHALPFGTFDARSAAMGGVGVATGNRFASFNNPALLTTADEIHEWFLLFPTAGAQLSDPDKLDDGFDAFQQAADTLDANPTPANAAAAQAALDALDGAVYEESGNAAFMLAVPSRILSGAAFINVYKGFNVRPKLGGDNLLADPPTYNSELEYRGFSVLENGVSAAKLFEGGKNWWSEWAVGFNAKFMLVEGYGYTENVRSAELKLDDSQRVNGSAFNVDVGVLKEFGVFKLGLVGKNLFAANFDYGQSGEQFEIGPQVRLGMAYQSRRSVLEFDVDLTENEALGFSSATRIAALGWEYQLARWFTLRAGYRQNMVDTKAGIASAGLGLVFGALYIDIAGSTGDEQDGVAAQLGFQF
jgi:hypothetical protein